MKKIKVFDCNEMPEDIRKVFFESYAGIGNDVYVEWEVGLNDQVVDAEYQEVYDADGNVVFGIVSKWLMANGASDYDKVLIKHWW